MDESSVCKRLTRPVGYSFRSTSSAHTDVEDLTYSKKRSPHRGNSFRMNANLCAGVFVEIRQHADRVDGWAGQ